MYAIADLAERGPAYGMASFVVDGQDVSAVEEAARIAVDKARSGKGPTLLEMKTYRYRGHSKNDPARYRSRDEVAAWRKRDPLLLLKPNLFSAGLAPADLDAAEAEIEQTISRAAEEADSEPFPDASDVLGMVYSSTEQPRHEVQADDVEQATMTYAEAVRWAIGTALTNNENSFLIGEDIGGHGGSFGVTRGLFDTFGPEKVMDAPISEAAIAGLGMGAAMVGARPIVEIQFSDFLTNAMDAVVNQAAKIHFMSGGKTSVPLVIRTPMGGGVGMAAQHSQCLEAWFYHVPGLKVVAPSTPDDARGLLLTAVRDNNPVIFFEHKNIYSKKGNVSLTSAGIPFGVAAVRRSGSHATIVTYSAMVDVALAAAGILAEQDGVEIEVLDLRTLFPLDWKAIEASVAKTRRLIVCHEAVERGGVGGDIAARICSGPLFRHLASPVLRIGAVEAPVPFSPGLEASVIPNVDRVLGAIRTWLRKED
jgi:2-oxoisovalerate dehydrogenase E1 component